MLTESIFDKVRRMKAYDSQNCADVVATRWSGMDRCNVNEALHASTRDC